MSNSKSGQKDKWIKFRCSEDDYEAITKKAIVAGLTTSEYLRRTALNRRIQVRTDIRMMNELKRLGGLQKHLYTQMQEQMTTELSRQFSEVLSGIVTAINALDMTPVEAKELED
ncbi:plasmid mobilization protein MobA [Pantoea agglomerans]|uniref:Mobilization protein n=1 Tax=Pantoea vagans TaxID=470934 RepID=A0AAN1NVC5_9GAMM|nr:MULTISPECIES: plasmid mobilization protein MobA [Pantoea]AVV40024.1 mobilization protein [Pantoea vagans]MBD8145814.1 mobilization protein [Pantoea agglomerans]QIA54865.1 mobilization protein [Pantoea agglomerans]WVL82689.1 plasmid mobilization protein MobA [Pantoea agglomerans]WVL87901.1 plasmid mobilization protein MobA [Pantoea agglomerans]